MGIGLSDLGPTNKSNLKARPWKGFSEAETGGDYGVHIALKRAQEIKLRNDKLIQEIHDRQLCNSSHWKPLSSPEIAKRPMSLEEVQTTPGAHWGSFLLDKVKNWIENGKKKKT